jgi:hypothetical protein
LSVTFFKHVLLCAAGVKAISSTYSPPDAESLLDKIPTEEEFLANPSALLAGFPLTEEDKKRLEWAMDGDLTSPYPEALKFASQSATNAAGPSQTDSLGSKLDDSLTDAERLEHLQDLVARIEKKANEQSKSLKE